MGEYSVETKNRFQLILDSDDEDVDVYDILREKETKPVSKKADPEIKNTKNAKTNEKKDKSRKPGQKVDNANVANIQKTQNRTAAKGNENRPPRLRQQNDTPKPDPFEKPPNQEQSSGFSGRGGGFRRGGSAGYRGGRGGGRGRKFDRHSGSERTGVKAVEKREGFGSHNWGGEVDAQLDTSTQQDTLAETGEKVDGTGEQTTIKADDGADAEPEPEPEPEVKEMTLDEWKAAQASSRTKQNFNTRRAGEGEDPKQWKKTVALEPRKRAESTSSYEEEHDLHGKGEETRAALDKLNIKIRFSDNSRGGPGGSSGGRGGGRGRGRGFGGGRPPRRGRGDYGGGFNQRGSHRSEDSAPRVDNEAEFPSLGSK